MFNVLKHSQIQYDSERPYLMEVVNGNNQTEVNNVKKKMLLYNISQRVSDIKVQANIILKDAKEEAKKIIANAKSQAENLFKIKEKEGYEQGFKQGREKYLEAVEEMEDLKLKLIREYENKIEAVEDQILDISIALAKKIIDIEFYRNDEAILSVLKTAMDKFKNHEINVELSKNNIQRLGLEAINYKLNENKDLGDRDIIFRTENGIIDVSIDNQFENLKNALLKVPV